MPAGERPRQSTGQTDLMFTTATFSFSTCFGSSPINMRMASKKLEPPSQTSAFSASSRSSARAGSSLPPLYQAATCGLQSRSIAARLLSIFKVYPVHLKQLVGVDGRRIGKWLNNGTENSHQPLRQRERGMLRFRRMRSLQKFAAIHGSIHNHFNQERHLTTRQILKARRDTAINEWRQLCAA